jgi:hypothetical protein
LIVDGKNTVKPALPRAVDFGPLRKATARCDKQCRRKTPGKRRAKEDRRRTATLVLLYAKAASPEKVEEVYFPYFATPNENVYTPNELFPVFFFQNLFRHSHATVGDFY